MVSMGIISRRVIFIETTKVMMKEKMFQIVPRSARSRSSFVPQGMVCIKVPKNEEGTRKIVSKQSKVCKERVMVGLVIEVTYGNVSFIRHKQFDSSKLIMGLYYYWFKSH